MLGVPAADRQDVRLRTDAMLHREPGDPSLTPEGIEAGLAQAEYFSDLAAAKRRDPGDDMITRLVQAELPDADGPQRLTDLEIASFASLLGGGQRDRHQAHRQRRRPVPSLAAGVGQDARRSGDDPERGRGDPALLGAVAVPGPLHDGAGDLPR